MALPEQAASLAAGTFRDVFDPFGEKATRAGTLAEERERKRERHVVELDLKQKQIEQARIQNLLKEDARKAAADQQRLTMSGYSPDVAADIFNSMDFGEEVKFDQDYFNATEEVRFNRGSYKVDARGQRELGPDGKGVFIPTGENFTFGDRQEFINEFVGTAFDPRFRSAMALRGADLDIFKEKKEIEMGALEKRFELAGTLARQKGDIQLEVARIQAGAKKGTGKATASELAREERVVKDFRKVLEEKVNKSLGEDFGEEVKNRWTIQEARNIKSLSDLEKEEGFNLIDNLRRLQNRPALQNKILQQLKSDYNLPKDYVKYLKTEANK